MNQNLLVNNYKALFNKDVSMDFLNQKYPYKIINRCMFAEYIDNYVCLSIPIGENDIFRTIKTYDPMIKHIEVYSPYAKFIKEEVNGIILDIINSENGNVLYKKKSHVIVNLFGGYLDFENIDEYDLETHITIKSKDGLKHITLKFNKDTLISDNKRKFENFIKNLNDPEAVLYDCDIKQGYVYRGHHVYKIRDAISNVFYKIQNKKQREEIDNGKRIRLSRPENM